MDKYCFFCLILNAIGYLLTFYFYQRKKKVFDIGSIILLTWIVGSMGSLYYYTFEVAYLSYYKITLFPLIYLFICNLIIFKPFLKADYSNYKTVRTYNLRKVLTAISIFFSIIGIPAFINAILKLSSFSLAGAALAEMYALDEDKVSLIFSPTIKPFYSIMRHFVNFIIFLFFYSLTKKNNRLLSIGLGLNVMTFFLVSLLSGSRGGILSLLLSCVFFAFFMRYMFSTKVYKFIMKLATIVIIILGLGVSAISISRLSDMSNRKGRELLMDQWISQYAGEGIIRFDNTIWHIDNHLHGYQNLPVLVSLVDYRVKDLDNVVNICEPKVKIPITVFYTYVGDLVMDFGKVGALIAVIVVSFIIRYLIRPNRKGISIYHLIILNYFFVYITVGFTANIYRTYYSQIPAVEIIGLLLFLYLFQKINSYKNGLRPRHCHSRIQENISSKNA